ncbi:MAG: hypothetical protein R6U29_13605 [Desulfosudaceae bacterium]
MKKPLSYRLFGLGKIPGKVRPIIESEEVVVADEGMGGWFITRHVNGPGQRYRNRVEGFSGCLVVTKKRILCFTYRKRQINIAVDDAGVSELRVSLPAADRLGLAFESSVFRRGWSGLIEFQFRTDQAPLFYDVLVSLGAADDHTGKPQKQGYQHD